MQNPNLNLTESQAEQLSSWVGKLGEAINDIADQIETCNPEELPDKIVLLLRLSNQLKAASSNLKYQD
jgi:hypothetical protein